MTTSREESAERAKMTRVNKLNARKVELNGIKFDSQKEARRYVELLELEKNGAISNLCTQVEYVLCPTQRDSNGKVVERKLSYIADFVYFDEVSHTKVVEDVKGYRNPSSAAYAKYVIKRKLMRYIHGIIIKET